MTDASDQPVALPQGVQDAILNRGQLARALGVSEPTVDRWITDGMPVEEGGSNGRPYKFLLSACWVWKVKRDGDDSARVAEAERAVQQMRLALIGGGVGDTERSISPKQRAELYEAEYRWAQAARARGELVPQSDIEDAAEDLLATIRDAVVALPDRLQRECNLDNRQTEHAIRACDDILTDLHGRLAARFPVHAEGQSAPPPALALQ